VPPVVLILIVKLVLLSIPVLLALVDIGSQVPLAIKKLQDVMSKQRPENVLPVMATDSSQLISPHVLPVTVPAKLVLPLVLLVAHLAQIQSIVHQLKLALLQLIVPFMPIAQPQTHASFAIQDISLTGLEFVLYVLVILVQYPAPPRIQDICKKLPHQIITIMELITTEITPPVL